MSQSACARSSWLMCLILLPAFRTGGGLFIRVKYILDIDVCFVYLINISFVFRLLDTKLMASTQPFKVFLKLELSLINYVLNCSDSLLGAWNSGLV